MKIRDLTGKRFGKLTVSRYAGKKKNRQSVWECFCDCGKEKNITGSSLKSGRTKSCGCLHRKYSGEAANGRQTPEYSAWAQMKSRCSPENKRKHSDYSGRGISVCERWEKSYSSFLNDVGRRPSSKHSLDRIDNDGNYEPGNVRWAVSSVQQFNRRRPKRNRWKNAAKYAYDIVSRFEEVIADYAGAKYAVTCDSCTDAIMMACKYLQVKDVEIPKFTYCGVPMSIIHAGGKVSFRDEDWKGMYSLDPYPIYDCARIFTSGMYIPGSFMCLSFHWAKHLPIGRGGAIICDDKKAYEWLKRFRFDGRDQNKNPKNDNFILGIHSYMTPDRAANGLMLMANFPLNNEPLPNSDYPDLSKQPIFKEDSGLSVINQIENLRRKNNGNWMDLLRLAYRHNPQETKEIMSKIHQHDKGISDTVKRLTS